MNILLINHYAGSPAMGMEYRPYYLAQHWIKSGHNVTIVASSFSHVRSVQPQVSKNFEIQDLEGIHYVWMKTKTYKGNTVARFINILEFVFKLYLKSRKIAKTFTPDVVIASSTYPLDIYPARCISKKARAKLVYEIHDLWPLSPMVIGGYTKYHPFILMMQAAENYCYKYSDVVISILPKTLQHCVAHGLKPEKWHHVPNGIYINETINQVELPVGHKDVLEQIRSEYRYMVGYTGNIGLANALDSFVLAAAKLSELHTAVVLVGNGPEKENLLKLKSEQKISNIFFMEAVPKNTIPALLSLFDFLFIGWLNRYQLYKFGISPNKLMDYMMASKPIIHAVYAGNDLVSDAKCGITIEPENPDAIVDAVKTLISLSSDEKINMGEQGRTYVLKNHDYSVIAELYLKSLEPN